MLFSFFSSEIFCFLKAKGSKQINAIKYRSPAKVSGGISANPHLIIINEVDHKIVTSTASDTVFKLDTEKFFIKRLIIPISIWTIVISLTLKGGNQIDEFNSSSPQKQKIVYQQRSPGIPNDFDKLLFLCSFH